ncbi:hypothetical protein L873DRAFT_1723712 [Choiromyces venosus 120613-1]|uniref:HTH CENPB-type domain-containing protein n=1 Tax=Choiromyces venosus 120613-1 TaxID=1336337 RepID=A0A3N4IVQ3_9PEZI|nr:hypothetical protein L873DRAFT_1723712 [Choiromyces venosus 120613-1]
MPPLPSFILPSQRVEPYNDIEICIQATLRSLQILEHDTLNIAAAAWEFEIPISCLRVLWKEHQSKLEQDRPGTNKILSSDQELAVCQYLDRLDNIGTNARLQILIGCANAILQNAHSGSSPAPPASVVSDHWFQRFLNHHPEYFIRKQQTIYIDRINAH